MVTKNGTNFIVLLSDIEKEHLTNVSDRIQENWEKTTASSCYLFSYEWAMLEP